MVTLKLPKLYMRQIEYIKCIKVIIFNMKLHSGFLLKWKLCTNNNVRNEKKNDDNNADNPLRNKRISFLMSHIYLPGVSSV